MDFCAPESEQHTKSLYYLKLLADYGPLKQGGIIGGPFSHQRVLTSCEIKPIIETYQRETQEMIRLWINAPKFHQPQRYEIVEMFEKFLPKMKRLEISYPEKFSLQTRISFCDLSNLLTDHYS